MLFVGVVTLWRPDSVPRFASHKTVGGSPHLMAFSSDIRAHYSGLESRDRRAKLASQ